MMVRYIDTKREAARQRSRYAAYRRDEIAKRRCPVSLDDFMTTEEHQGAYSSVEFDWGPIPDPSINDCGTTFIDNAAKLRAMQDVWFKLENTFPLIRRYSLSIWQSRRSGTIRAAMAGDSRFQDQYGPDTQEGWEALAIESLFVATGRRFTEEDLYKYV